MTNKEFSDQFDTLLNSYKFQVQFGDSASKDDLVLNEYEKSVFLTQAQEDLILSYYNGVNPFGLSFESSEEVRRYLAELVETTELTEINATEKSVSSNSHIFTLPENLLFITYEFVKYGGDDSCLKNVNIEVIPVTQDDLHRTLKNPFRGPSSKKALRLDIHNSKVEIVYPNKISKYFIRYIKKPGPIILEDLHESLSIYNSSAKTECQLHPALHKTILEAAVKKAIISRSSNAKA